MEQVKKKNNIIYYLRYLLIIPLAFILGMLASVSLGSRDIVKAYHLNTQGNLISDNVLLLQNKNANVYGVNYVVKDNIVTLNGTATGTAFATINVNQPILLNGTYTISAYNDFVNNGYALRVNGETNYSCYFDAINKSCTWTFNNYSLNDIRIRIPQSINNNNLILKMSLVESNYNPLEYEPYGKTYYSEYNVQNGTGILNIASATGKSNEVNNYTYNNSYFNISYSTIYLNEYADYLSDSYGSADNNKLTITFTDYLTFNNKYIYKSKNSIGSGITLYNNNTPIYSCSVDVVEPYGQCIIDLITNPNYNTKTFNKILIESTNYDSAGYSFGLYDNQFDYQIGYDKGYEVGYENGNNRGQTIGYYQGYQKAEQTITRDSNTLVGLFNTTLTSPITMLQSIFNFEFLGVNLSGVIFSIVSLLVVAWLIKRFI